MPARSSAARGIAPASPLLPQALARLPALVLALALGGCGGLFFQPDRVPYYFPPQFGLAYEDVFFRNADGTELTAWFLPAQGEPRGTVVFFHGNAANITNHLVVVRWLPAAGYAVFLFDYRGYGVSGGEPSRAGLIADGVAALRYVRARPDVDPERLIVFGQSLGGAVAVSALADAGTQGVRALVVEGTFASYREVARRAMNDRWYLWLFQYPLAYLFLDDDNRPLDALPRLAEVPLLVVHGKDDQTVAPANGQDLYDAFPGVDKTLWLVEKVRHGAVFVPDDSPWRQRLLDYLADKLASRPAERSAAR